MVHILKLCDGDKAPGPDGFTMCVFKECWEIIVGDVKQTIHNFHQSEVFVRSLNVTFVALIRQKFGPEEIKEFMPISLVDEVIRKACTVSPSSWKSLFFCVGSRLIFCGS